MHALRPLLSVSLLLLALVLPGLAGAQGTRLLREPTVSQDHIVFVHANDLWRVGREGGDADGRWIAFSGQYDGENWNPELRSPLSAPGIDVRVGDYLLSVDGIEVRAPVTPPFVDGGRMVAPRGGFYGVDGNWAIDAVGVAPDIEVRQTPAEVIAGRDPQLERAVQEALRLLETQGVELEPEPAPPVRWRRPDPR